MVHCRAGWVLRRSKARPFWLEWTGGVGSKPGKAVRRLRGKGGTGVEKKYVGIVYETDVEK